MWLTYDLLFLPGLSLQKPNVSIHDVRQGPKYSGTSVHIINSFQNWGWVLKLTSTKGWSIFSCRAAAWNIPVLASVTSLERAPSAETLFSHQNATSTGCDEFWSRQVPRCDCISLSWELQITTLQPILIAQCTRPCWIFKVAHY